MTDRADPDDLELAAMLCSRVCHDVISPVGAIANGFEVLEDESDEAMREMALEVIENNARKASARLQFARLAFGAMGSAGDRLGLEEARRLTEALFEGEKARIVWRSPADAALPKDQVKLLVNLVTLAAQSIPRGGEIVVEVADGPSFRIVATGSHAAVPAAALPVLSGRAFEGRVDAHSIQPYFTGRLAAACGMRLGVIAGEGVVEIGALPLAELQPGS